MQAFGLTKMQFLQIILLVSVFVLSSALAKGILRCGILNFFNKSSSMCLIKFKVLIQEQINFLPEPEL